jgi:parallel beta-helix repeat protein
LHRTGLELLIGEDIIESARQARTAIMLWKRLISPSTAVCTLIGAGLGFPGIQAATCYVATNGLDGNPGTLAQPFQTIQRAATNMVAGDTCYIRSGVYRETLMPIHSGSSDAPLTFTCYSNELVIINAADVISGWTQYSGNIYQAPMSWTLGDGYNQVFVDGQMMIQARYPNTGLDPMHPTLANMTVTSNTISCPGLNQANDFWKGGTIAGGFGYLWAFQCAMITSSVPGSVSISQLSNPWFTGNGQGFVTGVLGALDTTNEWHYQNSRLYLWPPGSDNPAYHLVEAKRRAWCVDFNCQSWIVADGLKLFGGSVRLAAANCVLRNCSARYLSHFTYFPASGYSSDGGVEQGNNGIYVHGNNNVISNCTITLSAGSGIIIRGARNTITRNTVSDIDYSGTYSCPLTITKGGGNRIWFNTMYNAGRDVIHFVSSALDEDDIRYNDLSRPGLLCHDLGVIYQWGEDGKGTRIAYNWVHDNSSPNDRLRPGIYVDNWCRNFVLDHNVVWNCPSDAGIRINGPATNLLICNNTLFNCDNVGTHPYDQWPSPNPDQAFWTTDVYTYSASNNLYLGSSPSSQLVNSTNNDFRLLPTAPALNAGVVIPGYTDGYCGPAPDLGAYELGLMPWTAGTNGVGRLSETVLGTPFQTGGGKSFLGETAR